MEKFLKCDFHHHTYLDSSNKCNLNYSDESFYESIETCDLDVISFTDHNSFDLDLFNNCVSKFPNITFIPGVELNVFFSKNLIDKNNLIVSKDDFHAVVLFNPDSDLRLLSNILKAVNEKIEFDELLEKFKSFEFYFIPHSEKHKSLDKYIPKGKSNNNFKFQKSLYYYNLLGLDGKYEANLKSNNKYMSPYLKKDIPVYEFSDRKSLGSKFTWIEFNGTFEGIISAIASPRFKIIGSSKSKYNPQKNLDNFVSKMKFEQNGESKNIEFSPSFNAIIGSRGSGKSILAKMLCNSLSTSSSELAICNIQCTVNDNIVELSNYLYIEQEYFTNIFNASNTDFKKIKFLNEKNKMCKIRNEENKSKILSSIDVYNERINTFFTNETNNNGHSLFLNEFIVDESNIKKINIQNSFDNNNKKSINNISSIKVIMEELNEIKTFGETEIQYLNDIYKNLNNQANNIINIIEEKLIELEAVYEIKQDIVEQNNLQNLYFDSLETKLSNANNNLKTFNQAKNTFTNNSLKIISAYHDIYMYFLNISIVIDKNKEQQYVENTTFHVDEDEYNFCIKSSEEVDFSNIIRSFYKSYSSIEELVSSFVYDEFEVLKGKINGHKIRNANSKGDIFTEMIKHLKNSVSSCFENSNDFISILKNGKEFNKLSAGQRAEALLIILFEIEIKNNQYDFVVLDQPEDNLDNVTIKDTLIKCINQIRSETQIFVISHSAPVVVNGNATNIIVCENDTHNNSTNFKYKTGTIINEDTKNNIVEILDGGEKYIKERFIKYKFKEKDED